MPLFKVGSIIDNIIFIASLIYYIAGLIYYIAGLIYYIMCIQWMLAIAAGKR